MRRQDQLTMTRTLIVLGVLVAALAGCASAPSSQPGGQSQAPGGTVGAGATQADGSGAGTTGGAGASGGTSLADRANAVKDVCTLMPADLAAKIVPGGAPPQGAPSPPSCTVSNGTQALAITISAYDPVDALNPSDVVPGLGVTAYMQVQFVDDAYLKIVLTQDHGAIYVEVAGHDGKDHKADAIAVGQSVLAHLP